MTRVEREGDGFVVDAAILSAAFGRPEPEIRAAMADGRMTTRCEAGSGEDAGRWRLTFFHAGRAFRLTVDAEGQVLKRAIFDVPQSPFSIP
ncbi:MAG: hypothetical protein B7Z02_06790 [Rhodobacterales bacterium 32-67-9]|nr:MAG: hypothetical protein B7Z02_06790 [Rhodobacterales bacterium 32-67-9]